MNFLKKDGHVYFTDLTANEISSFCKIDTQIMFAATHPDMSDAPVYDRIVVSYLKTNSRDIDGMTNCTYAANAEVGDIRDISLDKNKLISTVGDVFKNGEAMIMMTEDSYDNYVAVIDTVGKFDSDFINNACYVSFVDIKGKDRTSTVSFLTPAVIPYYFVMFPDRGNKPNHMYFFEDDRSLLIFNQKGWDIIYNDNFRSIADIIS